MGVTSDEAFDALDRSLVNLVAREVFQIQIDLFDVGPDQNFFKSFNVNLIFKQVQLLCSKIIDFKYQHGLLQIDVTL